MRSSIRASVAREARTDERRGARPPDLPRPRDRILQRGPGFPATALSPPARPRRPRRCHLLPICIVLLLTVAVVVANLAADLLYAKLDPRIGRAGGANG